MFYVFSIFTCLLYLSSNTVVLRIFCDIGVIHEDKTFGVVTWTSYQKNVLCWLCCFIVILWFRDRQIVCLRLYYQGIESQPAAQSYYTVHCVCILAEFTGCLCMLWRRMFSFFISTAGWTVCRYTMQVLREYNPEPIRREVPEDSHDQ
jgi:hypothetical protein